MSLQTQGQTGNQELELKLWGEVKHGRVLVK